jgi:hypothetical protein
MLLSQKADVLAIPFFLLATVYFAKKKEPTPVESVLLLFSAGGLVADTYFVLSGA